MRRVLFRFALFALFVLAAGGGILLFGSGFGNRLLHDEVESQMARLLRGPVSIERISLSIDRGLQLHGNAIDVYPGTEQAYLRARDATARIDIPSLIVGRFKVSRLAADGIHLDIERSARGEWAPTPFALLAARPDTSPSRWEHHLGIVRAMESVTRFLLERPVLAQTVELRNGSVTFRDEGLRDGAEASVSRLQEVSGSLVHDWFGSGAELQLSASFLDERGGWSKVEAHGIRGDAGRLQISLAVTALPLPALAPYAREIHPEAELAGSLTGVLTFTTQERGHGVVEADWALQDLDGGLPVGSTPLRVDTPHAKLYTRLQMHPGRLRLSAFEFDGANLRIAASGVVDRPVLDSSRMQLAVEVKGAGFGQVRRVAEALPEEDGLPILRLLDRVEDGHILGVEGRGRTRVARWRQIVHGEIERLPESFVLGADVSDLAVRIGGDDRLTGVGGRVQWSGDRATLERAHGSWKGQPLPTLDLTIEGLSHLLASDAEARAMPPVAASLPGASALIDILDGPDEPGDPPFRLEDLPAFTLDIEHLLHPVLMWPLEQARLQLQGAPGGLRAVLEHGTWAKVPIRGEVFWEEEPGRRVTAQFVVSDPPASGEVAPPTPEPEVPDDWIRSRVEVEGERLATLPSNHVVAQLSVRGASVELRDVEAELIPSGVLRGRAELDLSSAGAIPISVGYELRDAELREVGPVFGMRPGLAVGRVHSEGWLEGTLLHDTHLMAEMSGQISVRAEAGEIRQRLPLILALAQASENWNAFGRDSVLFDAIATDIVIDRGRFYTEAFTLEGPTQLFASGWLDVGRPVQAVDALVGVFLFPNADRALDDAPLIKAFLPGSSRGLVGAYFEMDGTWDEPEVRALPIKTLAEQLPGVIKAPLRAIKQLFGSGEKRGRPPTPPVPQRGPGEAVAERQGDARGEGS